LKNEIILETNVVTKKFGGLVALENVSIKISRGSITGLIGPNGAGKTTLFNCITGVYRPEKGSIMFEGEDITGLAPEVICHKGIGRTFQVVRPLHNMTVLDNVIVSVFYGKKRRLNLKQAEEEALNIIEFVGLKRKENEFARNLTAADMRRLEVARALATRPKLLLLDEPLAGLNPKETDEALKMIKKIRDEMRVTIFWIEHVMRAIMRGAERIIVLNAGRVIAEGKPEEVAINSEVIKAYLGVEYKEVIK
jgi:branched-chain amino acid transport system ATP-binding protein